MLKVKKNASSRTNEAYPVFVNSKEAAKEKSIYQSVNEIAFEWMGY